jgi:hypothetical protein
MQDNIADNIRKTRNFSFQLSCVFRRHLLKSVWLPRNSKAKGGTSRRQVQISLNSNLYFKNGYLSVNDYIGDSLNVPGLRAWSQVIYSVVHIQFSSRAGPLHESQF